jgi:hypothetical protein
MTSLLRRLLILAAALGFLVTSVGWGVAGALKAFNPHYENQFGLTQSHKDDHHHHDGQTAQSSG